MIYAAEQYPNWTGVVIIIGILFFIVSLRGR